MRIVFDVRVFFRTPHKHSNTFIKWERVQREKKMQNEKENVYILLFGGMCYMYISCGRRCISQNINTRWNYNKNTTLSVRFFIGNQPDASRDVALQNHQNNCHAKEHKKKAQLSSKVTSWFNTFCLVWYSPFSHHWTLLLLLLLLLLRFIYIPYSLLVHLIDVQPFEYLAFNIS